MPLYSPVQGSYKFSSSPSSNTAPQCRATRICAAKVQRFRKEDLVDSRIRQSTLYTGRGQLCSIVCNPRVLTSKRYEVTPLSGILFPPGGKCHRSSSGTGSNWLSRLDRLSCLPGSGGSSRVVNCLALQAYSGSHPASIATAVCLMSGPGTVQAEFCSRPVAIASA